MCTKEAVRSKMSACQIMCTKAGTSQNMCIQNEYLTRSVY